MKLTDEIKADLRMVEADQAEIDMLIAQLQPLPRPSRAIPWLIAPALALAFAAGVWLGRLL
jgi:hypothetical protein